MDAARFDRLTRTVATTGTRRRALALGIGLGVAAVGGRRSGVRAAPPEEKFNVIDVDAEFVDAFWTETCDFEVVQRIEGSIKQAGSRGADGNFVPRLETFRLTQTLAGPGETLTWRNRGSDTKFVFNPDGTVTLTAAGPLLRLTVPGEGTVVADIGRHRVVVTFDDDGNIVGEEVLWKAGPSPDDSDAADLAVVCAWLRG